MSQYSYGQLEQLWISAGGSSALAPLMAAIAMAESGGESTAENPSGASGLWQILGAVNPADQDNLFDPSVNAHEAVLKYQSQGLNAWETYQNGNYKQFFNGTIPPSASANGSGSNSIQAASATTTGAGAEFWQFFQAGLGSLIGENVTGATAANPLTSLVAISNNIEQLFKWLSWLFNPSNWLRIGAFFVGLITLGGSLWMFKEAL